MLRGLAFGVLTVLGVVAAGLWCVHVAPAVASGPDCPLGSTTVKVGTGTVCLSVHENGKPSASGSASSAAQSAHQQACQKTDGTTVPCVTADGTWWPGHQCYAAPDTAPAGSPAWQGHTDGSLWQCTSCASVGSCHVEIVWVAPGQPAATPDPGTLAKDAAGQMQLTQAQANIAPAYPHPTYVGVQNWLWIPESQWSTLTKSTTAGGTTVTVTAVPTAVVWSMGPSSLTCPDAGRAWSAGMTDAATTSCAFAYKQDSHTQPDSAFKVSASIRYHLTWTCSGSCSAASGDLGLSDGPAGTAQLSVLQQQTVVVQ